MTEYEKLVLDTHKIILHAIHIMYGEYGLEDQALEVRQQQQRVIEFMDKDTPESALFKTGDTVAYQAPSDDQGSMLYSGQFAVITNSIYDPENGWRYRLLFDDGHFWQVGQDSITLRKWANRL